MALAVEVVSEEAFRAEETEEGSEEALVGVEGTVADLVEDAEVDLAAGAASKAEVGEGTGAAEASREAVAVGTALQTAVVDHRGVMEARQEEVVHQAAMGERTHAD